MTSWRPPRTVQERTTRSIRSMQTGSMDGRVVSALPIKPPIIVDDGVGSDEGEESDSADSVNLRPRTDYLTPQFDYSMTLKLTYSPWSNPDMLDDMEDRASIHVFWNNVFQRDLSYRLYSNILIIENPNGQFKTGDVITVKYWYDADDPIPDDATQVRMECWFSDAEIPIPGVPYYVVGAHGTVSSPLTGQNYGQITTFSHRYVNLQFIGEWESSFRLPTASTFPDDDDVEEYIWMMNFDHGASVQFPFYSSWTYHGLSNGQVVGNSPSCFLNGVPTVGEYPPGQQMSISAGVFSPSVGPVGGEIFASGDEGQAFTNVVKGLVGPDHQTIVVKRSMPDNSPALYNSGCTHTFDDDGTPVIISFDDTIYGFNTFEEATYNVTIGVTCVCVMKDN